MITCNSWLRQPQEDSFGQKKDLDIWKKNSISGLPAEGLLAQFSVKPSFIESLAALGILNPSLSGSYIDVNLRSPCRGK